MINKYDDMQLKFELSLDDIEDDSQERAISYQEARQISEASRQAFDLRRLTQRDDEGRGWFDEYLKLIEQGWPWRVACYIAWAASPKQNRWPKTLNELALKVLGLTGPRTIHTWREKHPTIDQVVALLQAAPLWEHRRDVIDALIEMAATKDYKSFNDRKLFLEMIGDYVPKSQLEVGKKTAGGLDEMSDDELRKWLGEDKPKKDPLDWMPKGRLLPIDEDEDEEDPYG